MQRASLIVDVQTVCTLIVRWCSIYACRKHNDKPDYELERRSMGGNNHHAAEKMTAFVTLKVCMDGPRVFVDSLSCPFL